MQREATGVLFSYFNKSQYHERCVPAQSTQAAAAAAEKPLTSAELRKMDAVGQDKVWRQYVENESRHNKQWEQNWGFMAEFDQKGNKKERKVLAEESTVFSTSFPNTDAGNYGHRVNTATGQRLMEMQRKFDAANKRSKPDKDIVCY
ncbi:hypothetical protein BOX15_Mlig028872g1 [Macrostomum lignano]|uniref:Uncharacterized protein n=2 Tax=Macrostomum lignano TaxID=282301 RepID=A0A267FFF0_9PLAT|nr:hypothetical protein BOX15_Mlig028872g1 [Macrostomum lignano]